MDKQQYDLKRIVQRISIFKDLEVEEVQLLLTLCQLATYPAGQQIYAAGELSRDMMVVLKGRLEVSTASGEPLGEIGSGTCTGEMGIFATHPRSATVTAAEDATGLVIPKAELLAILEDDPKMYVKVLLNVVDLLCHRLEDADLHIEEYARQVQQLGGNVETPPGGDS